MVILAVIASTLLTGILIVKKHQLESKGGKPLTYHFFDKSLEFLIPFTIIGTLFLLLSLLVGGTSDETTIQNLILFEKMVGLFKGFASMLKVGALVTVVLMIIFYLLSLTRIPSKYTSKLVPFFKKYQKMVKLVSLIVIILFSFTFFGTQAGPPTAKLRFRIHEIEGKYGELRQDVEDAVSQEVANKLLEKVKSDLPKDYREDLEEQDQFYTIFSGLRTEYESFKIEYEKQDPGAETIINNPPPPDPPRPPAAGVDNSPAGGTRSPVSDDASLPGERIVYDLFEESEGSTAPTEPPPSQSSTRKISEAKESVRAYQEHVQTRVAKLLQSEHGREIAIQLPKSITGKVKEVLFKALTERYPILEPVIGIFFGTLDKEVETRTQKAVDKVTSSLVQNPGNATSIIREEASKVVAETRVKTQPSLLSKARRIGEALRKKTHSIRDAMTRLKEQALGLDAIAELDTQIELLSCRNEELRDEAVTKLTDASPQITPEQVERIERLMEDTSPRLRESSINSDYYEEVPVQYYAAQVVKKLRSRYISEGGREAAAEIINKVNSTPSQRRIEASVAESLGLVAP